MMYLKFLSLDYKLIAVSDFFLCQRAMYWKEEIFGGKKPLWDILIKGPNILLPV